MSPNGFCRATGVCWSGYGCLPWVAAAVLRLRLGDDGRRGRRMVCALVFWIALAGLTPTGLMLAATVALACVAGARAPAGPRRCCAAVGAGRGGARRAAVAGRVGAGRCAVVDATARRA